MPGIMVGAGNRNIGHSRQSPFIPGVFILWKEAEQINKLVKLIVC